MADEVTVISFSSLVSITPTHFNNCVNSPKIKGKLRQNGINYDVKTLNGSIQLVFKNPVDSAVAEQIGSRICGHLKNKTGVFPTMKISIA